MKRANIIKGSPEPSQKSPLVFNWSGREDSNLRPPAPHADALARLRYVPNTRRYFSVFSQNVKL